MLRASYSLTAITLLAGVVSGVFFSFSPANPLGGIFLVYLPVFPLLLLGLSQGTKYAVRAGGVAFITATLLTGLGGAAFFAILIFLPVCFFTHGALRWKDNPITHTRMWYPVLRLVSELTAITALCTLLFLLSSLLQGSGDLRSIITSGLSSNLMNNLDPESARVMEWVTGPGSFVLFAFTGCAWILMVYGFAALANGLLATYDANLRPSLALTPGRLPRWLLALLCTTALYAFFSTGDRRFIAEAIFLLLLLPYFLSGLALFHAASLKWRYRFIWLILFYTLILSFWPAFLVVALGLYTQLAEILERTET